MTSNDLIHIYTERKNDFHTRYKSAHQRALVVSWLRAGLALAIAFLVYVGFQVVAVWWGVLAGVILYAFLVSVHEKLNRHKKFLQNLITLNDQEIKAHQGDYTVFDDGAEFADSGHPYAMDLDIFGRGSLFQRINRTCTGAGKERLADMLAQPLTTGGQIEERQQAVKELSQKMDFRQSFHAVGMMSVEKKEDQQQLLAWLDLPALVYGKRIYKTMLIAFPLLSATALGYWIFSGVAGPFIILALTQWGIIGTHIKRVTLFQDYIGSKRHLLEKFSEHFRLLQREKFAAATPVTLAARSAEASGQLQILASRSRALDLRLNLLASSLLNSTVLYDLLCVYRLEQWREKNRHHLGQWLEAIREADALNSLGTFVFNNPSFVFPSVHADNKLKAEALGHPLLPAEGRVCNDAAMDALSNVWIVTGANMAGKSTFLRAIGVNVVMALTGLAVCARRMECPLVEVYTGMRTTDSITDHQSYFFAELLRLQKIIHKLHEGRPLLILLDEILKGTNSADKLTGSEELVKQFVKQPCLTIVATHDIALGNLQDQYSQIRNYHFETFINGDELSFDYKLKEGVSTGKNATFLMKKMGIIEG